MDGHSIKFEIVREARIALEKPGASDAICGVPHANQAGLGVQLAANSDRQADDGVFSRDVIDLAMIGAAPTRTACRTHQGRTGLWPQRRARPGQGR